MTLESITISADNESVRQAYIARKQSKLTEKAIYQEVAEFCYQIL